MKTFSIITPCFNCEKYIQETMESVLGQTAILSGRANLQYIICDGSSQDGTLKIIEKLKNEKITVISEKDEGMYHALSKGLKLVVGDFCAYINAGDFYSKHALDITLDIFEQKKVHWLTGLNVIYNDKSQITSVKSPFKYRKNLIQTGCYGRILPFIQQESTFWLSDLNNLINLNSLKKMKYAGDFYLWSQFSQKTNLSIVNAYLGGFRIHQNQISENFHEYLKEMKKLSNPLTIPKATLALTDKIIWALPARIKKIFNNKHFFIYDHNSKKWI